MAMEGLLALVCASALLANPPSPTSPGTDDRDAAITNVLAVQTAMQQGREHLLRKNARAAVDVLESQLPKINGNAAYLNLLREAYQAYIQELRLSGQEAVAREYHRRLLILEPGAVTQKALRGGALAAQPSTSPKPSAVRGYRQEDDDPFRQDPADKKKLARTLLARADVEFGNSRFPEAGSLYEQASRADQAVIEASRSRWAYCKLDHVVTELNRQSTSYADLENELRAALALAPNLDFGKQLLAEIEHRRSGRSAPAAANDATAAEVAVRDLGVDAEGWSVLETANFRVLHRQAGAMAQQAARVAERTRTAMQRKWFGTTGPDWNPKCELYLHPTGQDYSQATHVPPASPGHSSFRLEGGRVIGRRIDLHCDDINLLTAVLPHEATHTVLAGNLGEKPVPRWADEGMAVLTEPRPKIERHLRDLPRYYQDRQLFALRQLMEMSEYPDARYVGPFYAESVSIVEFLANERGPQIFTQFVRDGSRSGYEPALQRHYGYRSFEELEERWARRVFGDAGTSENVAERGQ